MSHETWTRREPQADATLHIPMLPTYAPCELEVSNRRGLISVHRAPQGLGPTRASSQRGPIRMHISLTHASPEQKGRYGYCAGPAVHAANDPSVATSGGDLISPQSTSHIPSLRQTGAAPYCTRVRSSILCRFYLERRRPTATHRGGLRSPSACRIHGARGATPSPPLPKQLKSTTRQRHLPRTDARQCNPIPYLLYLERRRPTATHRGGLRSPSACKIHEARGATLIPSLPKQLGPNTRRHHLTDTDSRQCNHPYHTPMGGIHEPSHASSTRSGQCQTATHASDYAGAAYRRRQHHYDRLTLPNTFHCATVLTVSITTGTATTPAHSTGASPTHTVSMISMALPLP